LTGISKSGRYSTLSISETPHDRAIDTTEGVLNHPLTNLTDF